MKNKVIPVTLSRHEEATIRLYETLNDLAKRFDAGRLNQDDINSIKSGVLKDLRTEYEYLTSYKDARDTQLADEFGGHFGLPDNYDPDEYSDD